jgi:hypothetical protein
MSDLGWMLLGATAHGICWLAFGHEPGAMREELRAAFPKATFRNDEDRLYAWFERVRDFVLLPREARKRSLLARERGGNAVAPAA